MSVLIFYKDKALFPEELWPALEGEEGEGVRRHINRAVEKKAAMLEAVKETKPSDKTEVLLEKIKNATGGGEDGEGDVEDAEEDAVLEPEDEDFEEDEDEMAGDYDGGK